MKFLCFLILVFVSGSLFGQKKGKAPANDTIYDQAQVQEGAEFPGGMSGLQEFLAKNVKYPEDCAVEGTQGKVYVEFVIEKNGKISNVKIKRGVYPSLDKESMRVIGLMPKWKPAKNRGQKVRTKYICPINYIIN